MTARGRSVLALGLGVYAVAWVFGSRPLYPVATGLVLAVALAWAWVRLAAKPMHVRRHGGAREYLEGEDVEVTVEVEPTSTVLPPSLACTERPGRLGARQVDLRRKGRRLAGRYELTRVPRGRYGFEPVRLAVEDPFGLYRVELEAGEPQALLVYPRLVELDGLFSDGGSHALEGRRVLLRRPSGFELHSVREYEQGESLRKVHWRSTARRGQLMVKELEDAPRDEVAVLLDGEAAAVAGEPPESTFDVQVRAAGSILRALVHRNRRCVLVVNSALREVQEAHTGTADWRRALELLALAEPTATVSAAALVAPGAGTAGRALELVVVTARMTGALADALVQRHLSHRSVAVVYVDPLSFSGAAPRPEPLLLRLTAAGVPVAVVRRGDDLAAALGSRPPAEAAGA
ncbi:MAG TPA: DUF58 domain-containing protein [Gaiellaceae bacterium]